MKNEGERDAESEERTKVMRRKMRNEGKNENK